MTATGKKPVTIWQVFKPAIGIIVISVGMQLVNGPIMSFVSLFLVDVHQLTTAAASMWMTNIRMGGLIGSLIGGWLSDKWGRRRTIYFTLAIFGPLVFAIARLPFSPALAIVFILFGWLMTMRETTMQAYVMDICPPHMRATVFGIYFGFGQQGSSIIQPVAGNFMDSIGIGGVYDYVSFVSPGMSVIVVFLALRYYRQNRTVRSPETQGG